MSDEKPIPYDSDEAARPVTAEVRGWVSRRRHFFAEHASVRRELQADQASGSMETAERSARYDGCTTYRCDCGELTGSRTWTACPDCRAKSRRERYERLPEKPWAGEPLCVFEDDRFFFDAGELADWMAAERLFVADLELVLCKRIPPPAGILDDIAETYLAHVDGEPHLDDAPLVAAEAEFLAALARHWPEFYDSTAERPARADLEAAVAAKRDSYVASLRVDERQPEPLAKGEAMSEPEILGAADLDDLCCPYCGDELVFEWDRTRRLLVGDCAHPCVASVAAEHPAMLIRVAS